VLTEPNYRGYRIEAYAELSDGHWDATVRIRRLVSQEHVHTEGIPCRKITAALAETRAAIWAKRWVDQHAIEHEPRIRLG